MKKRRTQPGSQTAYIIVLSLLLSMVVILLRTSGCPGPPESLYSKEPRYLLSLPENASLPTPGPLQPQDFSKLVDFPNFNFVLNNLVCNDSSPLLLGLVHSHPSNWERRKTIRSTWGSPRGDNFKLLFLVGFPSSDNIQERIEAENREHRDMIQGNFKDAYRNLTYKHVMALKWTTYFCQKAKYVLKTDDDIFVNTPALLEYINTSLSPYGARGLILCSPGHSTVKRSWRSKWRVSTAEYKYKIYPMYCPGFVILYSIDVVFRLYYEAQLSTYFWIDDVFITGIMAARANYKHTNLGNLILNRERFDEFLLDGSSPEVFLFGPINLKIKEIKSSWEKVVSLNQTKKSLTTIS